jgi:3-oxoacyl-[acyl-carrier-protein] synthase-3
MHKPVYIVGLGEFFPNAPVSNDQMEDLLGYVNQLPSKTKRRILSSNGILNRYYAIDPVTKLQTHNNAQITAAAVKNLVSRVDFNMNDLDVLVCGTSSPDQIVPNHAQMVQGELKAGPFEVVSTAGVCVSGASSLKYAYLSIAAGVARNAIATGSELVSNFFRPENFPTAAKAAVIEDDTAANVAKPERLPFASEFLRWMLSDGAGAMLLSSEPSSHLPSLKVDFVEILSYSHEQDVCMYLGGLKNFETGKFTGWRESRDPIEKRLQQGVFSIAQDARQLNERIMNVTVSQGIQRVAKKYQLSPNKIDWFVPHYSSNYFREPVFNALKEANFEIPYERWFSNLTSKGNTGSASIYLMLVEMWEKGLLQKGQKILCYIPESARFAVSYIHMTVN